LEVAEQDLTVKQLQQLLLPTLAQQVQVMVKIQVLHLEHQLQYVQQVVVIH
jgi:hypothetical protein